MIQGFDAMEQSYLIIEKQCDQMREKTNKRFEQVDDQLTQNRDKRLEDIGRRQDQFMFWTLVLAISAALFAVFYSE